MKTAQFIQGKSCLIIEVEKKFLTKNIFSADEVQLTLLAKYSVANFGRELKFFPLFRNESSINLIPAFEGQPMVKTLQQQIQAGENKIFIIKIIIRFTIII